MTFCSFPFNLILSLSRDIDAFIFLPQGRPTNVGKELDPYLGLIISKSTFIDIPLIVVSTFFQTPIGQLVSGIYLTQIVEVYLTIPMCVES